MSTPAPSAPAVAVAPPYFRKSRRERLMQASFSPLWAGKLVPDAANDHDPSWPISRAFELHDVPRVQRGEVRTGTRVITNDDGLLGARQIRACVGGPPDPRS